MNARPNKRASRLILSLVAGFIVLLAAAGLLHRAFGDEVREARPAPSFALKIAPGKTVKLTDFKNKALIVCFLATTDDYCRQQLKILNDLQVQQGETNLAVLGFALDQMRPEFVKAYAEREHLKFPLYQVSYEIIRGFGGLTKIPTTFVIDKNQNIIQTYVGVTETNAFDDYLKAIAKQ